MAKITIIGSLNVDLTVFAKECPAPGETNFGTSLLIGPGGKGLNQATAAKRAGSDVAFIGKIGTDALSSVITAHLEDEQMCRDYIHISKNHETGTATIIVEATGQNRIIVVSGANTEVTEEEILSLQGAFSDTKLVLTQSENGLPAIAAGKAMAKSLGVPFLWNPAPYLPVSDDILDGLDFISPNETESFYFTGITVTDEESAKKAADVFFKKGVKNVIITMGSTGVFYSNGTESYILPPPPAQAIDTTGAGDTFMGGFCTALAEGMDIRRSLCFASCAASLAVQRKGAAKSAPYRAEIDALMKSHYQL